MREDVTKALIHHGCSRAQSIACSLGQEHGLQLVESCRSNMAMRGKRPGEREIAARPGDDRLTFDCLECYVRATAAVSLDEDELMC